MAESNLIVPSRRVFIGGRGNVVTPGGGGGSAFTPHNILFVDPDGALTSVDGGAYTTIQSALDAANAQSPSATDPWLVLVAPGYYDEGGLTLYSHVHLASFAGTPGHGVTPAGTVRFGLGTGAAGDCITSVANSSITGISFISNGTTGHTDFFQITHSTFVFRDCTFKELTSGTLDFDAGEWYDCQFVDSGPVLGGTESAYPSFYSCTFETGGSGLPSLIAVASTTAYGVFNGCVIKYEDGSASTQDHDFITVTSPNVTMNGCHASSSTRGRIIFYGKWNGGSISLSGEAGGSATDLNGLTVGNGARFNGTDILLDFDTDDSVDNGQIALTDLSSGGDVVFDGCTIHSLRTDGIPLFMFLSSLTTIAYRLIFTGCTFIVDASSVGSNLFKIHSSGFSGNVLVELNGNRYQARQTSMPTNASTGRLMWRGTDVRASFYPVATGRGTGAAVDHENYPTTELDAAGETAIITGRLNPPADLIIDQMLVLSAVNSDGIHTDTFTDTGLTALASHASDSGGAWTLVLGTMRIDAGGTEVEFTSGTPAIFTYSVGAANGRIEMTGIAGLTGTGERNLGILFRYSDTSNYWRLTTSDETPQFELYKRVAGVETLMYSFGSTSATRIAVEFYGDNIRVYKLAGSELLLVGEVIDDDLMTNTVVGLYATQSGGTAAGTASDWVFYPGGTVDVTVGVNTAKMGQPFETQATTAEANVPVGHKAYTLYQFTDSLGEGEHLWAVEVELDALDGNITDLYVHGVLVRTLPISSDENPGSSLRPVTGIIYR